MTVVAVTGAGGVIGSAIAETLSRSGHHALCIDIDQRVESVAAQIRARGGKATALECDLADTSAPEVVRAAIDNLGQMSLLVNNAGITRDARALNLTADDFETVIRVNLLAPLRMIATLAPRMQDGGAIVNVASRAALGNFGQANYVASKSGLIGATRALALQHAPRLRVNAVAPGLVDTPLTQAMPDQVLRKLIGRIPLGRQGDAEEIADAVEFLGSDRSRYVTGQTLLVCGGRSLAG